MELTAIKRGTSQGMKLRRTKLRYLGVPVGRSCLTVAKVGLHLQYSAKLNAVAGPPPHPACPVLSYPALGNEGPTWLVQVQCSAVLYGTYLTVLSSTAERGAMGRHGRSVKLA